MRVPTTIITFLASILLSASSICGQSTWEHFFNDAIPPNQPTFVFAQYLDVVEWPGAGYAALGLFNPTGFGQDSTLLTRLDAQGNVVWSRSYSQNGGDHMVHLNGDMLILEDFNNYTAQRNLVRYDLNGDPVDTISINSNLDFLTQGLTYNNNMELVLQGTNGYSQGGQLFLEVVDTNGTVLVDQFYNIPFPIDKSRCIPTPDGGYLLAAMPSIFLNQDLGFYLYKVNAAGAVQWSQLYNSNTRMYDLSNMVVTANGTTYLSSYGSSLPSHNLMAFDPMGTLKWNLPFGGHQEAGVLANGPNGSVLMGVERTPLANVYLYLANIDSSGSLVWDKSYPQNSELYNNPRDLFQVSDGSILFAGHGVQNGFVTRLDSTGNLRRNLVQGSVYQDLNMNCLADSTEPRQAYWLVNALPGNQFTVTDSNGYFEMLLDSGNHTLQLILPTSGAWDVNCPAPLGQIPLTFTGWTDSIYGADFGLEAVGNCEALRVELGSPFVRACAPVTHSLTYYNLGNIPANNAYVELDLDTLLTFSGSSIPATSLGGNRYRFDLSPIPVGGFGSFQVNSNSSCTAVLGESACSEARIYPNNSCNTPSPSWSGASIEIEGVCIPGDTIEFTLRNNSNNAMVAPVPIWVAEDDILKLQSAVQLGAQQTTSFKFSGAGGGSWACIADQVDFHPGNSLPRAFVEACGRNSSGGFSTGYVATVMQDELDYYRSIDCKEVVGSFDPNDKSGFPLGLGITHDILATDELDYLIRFQNTGTDTAFKVVITDVLPEQLAPSTFQVGTSSHPYTLNVLPGNELEWTFDPIELPDSNVNEPESHGFITFRIGLDSGLTPSTQIRNNVNIYFDYNLPVLTNTTLHTVREAWVDLLVVSIKAEIGKPNLRVYPNPSARWIRFEPEVSVPGHLLLEVFDLQGRVVHATQSNSGELLELDGGHLQTGVYIFRLSTGDGSAYTGKFILK